MAPAAPRPPGSGRGPPASVSRARDRRLEAARAAAESRVPGTWRVSPRPGRGPGSAGRCGQSEALPQGGLGRPGRREVGSGARGSAAQHMGHLPSGSSTRGSHLRDWQLPEDGGVGEGGWPGGAGRGLEAGAGSAGASSTRGQRGQLRRWRTRQETFRPGGGKHQNKRQSGPGARSPQPATPSPAPASPGRRLRPRATSSQPGWAIGSQDRKPLLPPWPPPPPPPPPPPQLTLPAQAAIVTLTETYRVHRHGNAHPLQGPSSAVSRAVVRTCHVSDAAEAMFVTGREVGKLVLSMTPAPSLLRDGCFKPPDSLSDHFGKGQEKL